LLVQAGALGTAELERGLLEHRRTGGKLGEVLVRLSLVTELQVTEALAQQLNLPVAPLDPLPTPEPEVLARIPAALAHDASVLPLELAEEGRVLVVAIDGPLRGDRLEQVRSSARCWVVPRLAPESALRRAILASYGPPPAEAHEAESSSREKRPQGRGADVVQLKRAQRTDSDAGPQHPEVRMLVELLLEKGLLTGADVRQAFPAPSIGALSHASSQKNDKESP